MLSVSVIGAGGREGVNIIHPPQIPTRKYQPAKSERRVPDSLPILLSSSASSFKWILCVLLLLL